MKHTALLLLAMSMMTPAISRAEEKLLLDSLPESWELEPTYFQTTPSEDRWWTTFDDPILTALINRAVANNYNVAAAQKRIQSAAQVSRATKAGYYPTISATAGWSDSESASAVYGEHTHSQTVRYFTLGLTANWEIDVFGRIRQQLKADKANYQASVADYDATLVSLCSNLAKAYIQLRMYQAEYEITSRSIATSEELQKLAQARYEVGLRPYLDVVQADLIFTQSKSTIPSLEAALQTSLNEISILVGEYPENLEELKTAFPLPQTPVPAMNCTPEELLRRRPDIIEAEKQLAATAAQIGIAKKDFLPTLSVSASIGTQSRKFGDLFGEGSLYYSVMPTLSWTIFEGMARNARVAEARYNMEAQIDEYNVTVMTAIQEVNNAMANWKMQCENLVFQQILLRQSRDQLRLQTERYTQGLNNFSDVATAQTTVLQYENSVVEAHASQLEALVTLYTALGGGY